MVYNSSQTITSGKAVFIWWKADVSQALDVESSGGVQCLSGSGTGALNCYYVAGSDSYTFGGWICSPIDPNTSNVTPSTTVGSPTSTTSYFGVRWNVPSSGPSKGYPFKIDAIRWGREFQITNGSLADGYATFSGAATYQGDLTRQWGLCQFKDGTYLVQGLFLMGASGTAVDFRDSNRAVYIANTKFVQSVFNTFEVRNASSRVDWTSISVQALGTVSKGRWLTTDNATINLVSCTFTDMDTFSFLSASTLTGTTFRRCALVTGGGAQFTGCTFDSGTASASVLVSDLSKVDGCTFASDGSNHAVELNSIGSGTMTWNCTATGYVTGSTGSPVTPGSSGNETIYVNVGSGTLTISVDTGATVPSIRSAGATVNVSSGAVTVKATAVTESGTPVESARVHLEADTGGSLPYNVTVTISNTGTTATVTHTSHGLETNDKVVIRGASLDANNGVFSITKTGVNTYTYTMGSTPGSSPTGTIKSTFVVLNGLTDSNGEITMSRVFPGDQPATGRIRKSSSAPFYKNAALTGTVDSGTGGSFTGVMISDD